MALEGLTKYGITGPRGPWTRLDNRPVPRDRGSLAKNIRFEVGRAVTRDGFANDFSVAGKITSFYHWITNDSGIEINRIIYMESGNTVKMRNMVDGSTVTLYTEAGRSAVPAEAGSRLYIPSNTTAGIGASKARVVNALISGSPSDYAFAGPMTTLPVITETGAGQCTAGDHLFGYILETRSGFTGKPSPFTSGVFAPVTATITSGGRALNMAVSTTTPSDAAYLHPIMTRRDNPNRWYFVPDASVAIPAGAVWTANMIIDISDEDLADSAEEVSENFDYLTQDSSGNGPFNPFKIVEVGQRMMYLTPQRAYISDPQDYQVLTEIEHGVSLPGQRLIVSGFTIRDNVYLLGPSWTYSVSDNNERPRFWGQPELVSGAIGTTGNNCVCWKTGGDYAWVANYSGLYFFNGQYEDKPSSYMVDIEWRRINWAAAYAIQMADDYVNQRLLVAVPLDGATEPTHLFVFDYARGYKWGEVDFSIDTLPSNFSSVGLVRDRATGRTEVWAGPAAAGYMLRQQVALREDAGSAIDCQYETSLIVPRASKWKHMKLGYVELLVSGSGTLNVVAYGVNHNYSETLETIALAAEPDGDPLIGADLNDENFSILLRTNAVGAWFDVSEINAYVSNWMRSTL